MRHASLLSEPSRHCLMFASVSPFLWRSSSAAATASFSCVKFVWLFFIFILSFFLIRILRAFPFRLDFGVCLFVYCAVCPPAASICFCCCCAFCFQLLLYSVLWPISLYSSYQLGIHLSFYDGACYCCWFTFKSLAKPVMALELGTIIELLLYQIHFEI